MTLSYLERPHKYQAVKVLCEAFHNYPVVRYVVGDSEAEYDEKLEELIGFFVEARLARNIALVGLEDGKELVGIAVVSPPVEAPMPPEFKDYYARVERRLGVEAMERLQRYNQACEATDPGKIAHYLGMVGILPRLQRRGLGLQMIGAVKELARSRPESSGIVLNTEIETNLPFYEKLGFQKVSEADAGPVHTWSFYWPRD